MRLASGAAADGVQVRLFTLTDLRQVVSTTTDASGYFALSLRALQRTSARPERFSIGPNYPNPFNPATVIPYHLPTATQVRLEVFNVLGQRIATLVDGDRPAGFHTATWHGTNAAGHAVGAGLYIYRLSGGGQAVSGRMVLLDGQAGIPVAGRMSRSASASGVREAAGVYGLTVSGQGLVPYVDPAFRVASDLGPVDLVVKARAESSSMKVAASGLLGDVNSDSRVDMVDALLVALYSFDSSIAAADNGALSLDDMNQDGLIDIDDALFLAKVVATSSTSSPLKMYWTEWERRDGQQREGSIRRANRDGSQVETVVSGLVTPEGIDLEGGKVYWTDTNTNSIQRANLDGSQVETLVSEGLETPSGIALMPRSWIYWTDSTTDRIQRSKLDGSQVETVVSGVHSPEGIDLYRVESWVYWTDLGTGSIQRSKPNGSQVETVVSDLDSPQDIALDRDADKMYWTEYWTGSIQRANIDGSQVETLVSGLEGPDGIDLALDEGKMYWTGAGSIQRANLDGSQVETLVSELGIIGGIALGEMSDYVEGSPDLVVPSLAASDPTVSVGELFTLMVSVRNLGNGPAAETTVRYYSSTDATISTSDTEVGAYAIRGLVINDQSTVWAGVTAPSIAGTYYYGACVDSVPGESNTDNNCSSAVEIVVAPLDGPDLVVQPPTIDDDSPDGGTSLGTTATTDDDSLDGGTSFELGVTVLNQGDEQATATTVRYYRSTDATITSSDTEIGTDTVSSLAAGNQLEVSTGPTAPLDAGTYYYGACVNSVPGESNPDNNCSAAVGVVVAASDSGPDLVVHPPTVSDSSPDVGTSFELGVTVRNRGDEQATATTVRYYRSTDAAITTSDTEIGTDTVSSLAAGSQLEVSTGPTAPLDAGTYYYGACIDSVPRETHPDNNCSVAVEVVVAPLDSGPDLVVQSPTVSDSSPNGGTSFELGVTVLNQGDEQAAATTVRYYRSNNTTITTADTEIGTDTVSSLAAGSQLEVSTGPTAPLDARTYYYGACVDSVPGESDTDNNCSAAVEIVVAPLDGPDLVVQSPTVSDSSPNGGTSFELGVTVLNQGDEQATATTVRYYRSTDATISSSDDATISSSDTEIGTDTVSSLAAGNQLEVSTGPTAPLDAGTYYYGACVDSVPGESDTDNNCSAAVAITISTPDLVVSGISAYGLIGTSFSLSATVRNQGVGQAAQTTVRYYRSTDATISTSDTEVGSESIPGYEVWVSTVLTLPSSPGTYYYGICVDSVPGESNTNNNCSAAAEVTVTDSGQTPSVPAPQPTVPPPSDEGPELVIQAEVNDSNPDAGVLFQLSARVRNQGKGTSENTNIRFYSSTDATISTSDTEIGSFVVYGLLPTDTEWKEFWLPAPSSAGTYYYGACVDVVPDESDTSNNCSGVSITIDP